MITLGLDVGSIFTKAVVLNRDGVAAALVTRTTGHTAQEAGRIIGEAAVLAKVAPEAVAVCVATGRGGEQVEQADFYEDDLACIALASRHLLPQAGLSVDIGGQSITVILSDDQGEVLNYMRNDRCASGTGRFLEVISAALGLTPEQIDETARQALKKVPVSTQCGVFAESEVVSYLNLGESVADITGGVCDSVARIVVSQVLRIGAADHYTVTGGVARFSAVTGVLAGRLGGRCHRFPVDPILAAAYGAALMGRES